ncbi:hypothetical protein [Xanthomonas campestris]|uniref:hypothetical protein n=1 Tax=Xanthomonas campestris TaxID=339 RepID=UPI000362ACD9|nr:hypothetical protein [Xanthomonas campestris]MCC5049739.1 hypothetical protein [Xanthomonas campestris]MCC5058067.1 hypothetical protein [Xanthomonas campestris]MCC5061886.1 hypothetical protein [Xanthomonas campestris]MDM7598562.1 hypothetical protein [Xanthomonas campestris pv. campestris]MDM7602918.1 hypothetical protein [Xanthomonas campestris pv. campestris]
MVEQKDVGFAPDLIERRPARTTCRTDAGTAGTSGQIHHRGSLAVATAGRQAHYAQPHARAVRFVVPTRHFQKRHLGVDRAVSLGCERVRRERQ